MKKIMTVLAAAGILMLGITGQAAAADGGSDSCTQNGGRIANCHLYHIKLGIKRQCVNFTTDKQAMISVCRQNSMNVYFDPGFISSITVNIDSADRTDEIKVENNDNWCFRLTQGTRYVRSPVTGVPIKQIYDKLQTVSLGISCDTS
jgi:hypothetical protein